MPFAFTQIRKCDLGFRYSSVWLDREFTVPSELHGGIKAREKVKTIRQEWL